MFQPSREEQSQSPLSGMPWYGQDPAPQEVYRHEVRVERELCGE